MKIPNYRLNKGCRRDKFVIRSGLFNFEQIFNFFQIKAIEQQTEQDKAFQRSKQSVAEEIDALERRIKYFYDTCTRQIAVLKSDIEKCNRKYLQSRKGFFTLAADLLDIVSRLETAIEGKRTVDILSAYPVALAHEQSASDSLRVTETNSDKLKNQSNLCFILDKKLNDFLLSFSAVGFLDDDSLLGNDNSDLSLASPAVSFREPASARTPPPSLAHILKL